MYRRMIAKTIERKRKGKLSAIELEIIVITGWLRSQCVSKNNVSLYLYRGPDILSQYLFFFFFKSEFLSRGAYSNSTEAVT